MIDPISLERAKLIHPKLREELDQILAEIDEVLTGRAKCRLAYTYRTFAEQDILYAQGRKNPGKVVTQARGGQSYHNYGLATDIVLLVDKDKNGSYESASWESNVDFDGDGRADWQEVVNIFKHYGWEWGGDWKFSDNPHFQKTLGKSINELLTAYNAKKVDEHNYVLI
jgi:peptidoglycan L-alanyl-D-glutamate endopeptidase CwlK